MEDRALEEEALPPGRYPQGTRFQTLGVPIPPDFSKEQELFTFQ